MKKTILFLAVIISINSFGQGNRFASKEDSLKAVHQMDSINTLVRTKMTINAAFIDSVSAIIEKDLRKSYTIDEVEKYQDALRVQQYVIQKLVAVWREQYAAQQKKKP